jgi:Pectate lyase
LNVTCHHNYYLDVEERMPRMRFGNAHVYNLYCENLGGKGIQSTAGAATLVENCYFRNPAAGSYPTIEANGGPTGTVKVIDSLIVNLPGNNVQFRQFGESNFAFNAPYAGPAPPYPYAPDPVTAVPGVVTNFAGVGKVGFELWQMEQFTPQQLSDPAVSGPAAEPAGDGVANLVKYALGLPPFDPVAGSLVDFQLENGEAVLRYRRPAGASDVLYRVQDSADLVNWSEQGIVQQASGVQTNGLETWEARGAAPIGSTRLYRLRVER